MIALLRPLAALSVALGSLPAGPALAETAPVGLRPLGGDWESGRTVGAGNWVIEGGAFMPMLEDPSGLSPTTEDLEVFQRWQTLPAWPTLRGVYGLSDGNEAVVELGPLVGGAYRRHFLRADAPWPGEYLQALIQLGGGFHLPSLKPMGYIRVPAIYERGAWTFHVGPGGYYMFNQQPIVDVQLGTEVRPLDGLHLGGMARLRMDAKALTPTEGAWSFSGGARYQLGDRWSVQLEASQDAGPPNLAITTPQPRIEFPHLGLRASVTYYNW
jgi:hypothetical protein